jgi:RNA polymerase sigma factor (sigma-70 family)
LALVFFGNMAACRFSKTAYLPMKRVKRVTCPARTTLIGVRALTHHRKEADAVDDSQIVSLYLSRDETAIARTAEKYGSRLRALALGVVRDVQTAEECENDAYWEAWRSIPPHQPRDYLYPFLARITRHAALDRCRERDRLKRSAAVVELSAELEQCLPAPDDAACRLDALALGEAINGFLAGLSREKRVMFLRRYWFLDSVAEVARRCGCSEGRVKTTLFRLRGQLRDYLEQEGYTL